MIRGARALSGCDSSLSQPRPEDADMSEPVRLPVLPLDDDIVLPGMVVPLDLSDAETRAAVDAARSAADARSAGPGIRSTSGTAELLLVPRTDGHYGGIGTRATIEQLGRL